MIVYWLLLKWRRDQFTTGLKRLLPFLASPGYCCGTAPGKLVAASSASQTPRCTQMTWCCVKIQIPIQWVWGKAQAQVMLSCWSTNPTLSSGKGRLSIAVENLFDPMSTARALPPTPPQSCFAISTLTKPLVAQMKPSLLLPSRG